ncbi:hypothetical protein NKG05_16815 [Oerskovia sp. M15]
MASSEGGSGRFSASSSASTGRASRSRCWSGRTSPTSYGPGPGFRGSSPHSCAASVRAGCSRRSGPCVVDVGVAAAPIPVGAFFVTWWYLSAFDADVDGLVLASVIQVLIAVAVATGIGLLRSRARGDDTAQAR